VIVLTVAIVNLAIGRRTFRPSSWGKVATACYIVTCLLFMICNYLRVDSPLLPLGVYTSLTLTVVSSLHYILQAARLPDASSE
jgi:hypothetical protein